MTTVYEYLAQHNPKGATAILNKYGYKSWDKWETNADALKQLVNKNGEQVLKDIAINHPDFKLIISHYKAPHIVKEHAITKVNEHANCDACSENSNCDGDTKCSKCSANADGSGSNMVTPVQDQAKPKTETTNSNTPTTTSSRISLGINSELLMTVALIGVLALIIKNS